MDQLYSRKPQRAAYPSTLYQPPKDGDADAMASTEDFMDILTQVREHASSYLPPALRARVKALVKTDNDDDDDDSSEGFDEKRWTTIDLPLAQHKACSYAEKDNMQHCGNGRLSSPEGWICSSDYVDEHGEDAVWYQLDAGTIRPIGGVVVKTHNDSYKWWCYFYCEYSVDGEEWVPCEDGEEFAGPDDCDEEEKVYFEENPPTARYIRIKGGGPYDEEFAGRFALLLEVSETETITFLAGWIELNGQYVFERIRAFLDKHCEKMPVGASNALTYFFKHYKRLVDNCFEDVCDAQGMNFPRLIQLIAYDLKYEKKLPHSRCWELTLAVKDVDSFARIVAAHREDLKARQAALMNQVGQVLTLAKGTPDIEEFHLVENAPLDAYQLWETRQAAKKQTGNSYDKKLVALKASYEAGALKELEYKDLCKRAESAEMALGWMFPHEDDIPPVYTHPVFTAEFLSSHFDDDVPSYQGIQAYARLLRDVVLDQQHWLGMNQDEFSSLQFALKVFANAIPIFQRYSKYMKWQYHTHLDLLIHDIGEQLDGLMPGQAAIFPVTRQPILLVVEVKTSKLCRVTVVNTNPHSEFHPKAADVPARIRQQTCVSLDNVEFDLLKEKGWWFFLIPFNEFRAEHIFYTHYLNWLHPGRTYESMLADTCDELPFRTPSSGGGQTWKAYHHATGYILLRRGVRDSVRRLVKFNLRHKLLNWVVNDLHIVDKLPSAHRRLIRLGCEQIAASAAKTPGMRVSKRHLRAVLDCLTRVNDTVARLSPNVLGEPPPLLDLDSGVDKNVQSDFFPQHEYLRRIDDIEHLIGERIPDVDFLPANFLIVPDRVATFEDALAALRNTDMLCTRCMVQRGMIRNRLFLCVSLIQHVFLQVLPLPRWKHADCIWQQNNMKYSQQMEALLVLSRLMEHWASCVFSLRSNPEFDAVRITVAGAIAAVADCVLRQEACDQPSRLSTHLRGWRDSAGFAFTTGYYGKQSETIKVTSPEVVVARTIILDYFEQLIETIPTDHYIFMWESGLDRQLGCQRLFFQLAKAEAFSLGAVHEYMYSPNDPHYLIQKVFPEFKAYRDIVFYFKYFMNTLPGGFPSIGDYTLHNAQLRWQFNTRTMCYEVQAFGKYLNSMAKPNRHRWPSYAIASRFTYPTEALTEDDILHIKSLPSFGDVMGQRDSELLLSYLTVPYLRIPLVLNFFATEDRVSLLRAPSMQQLLDSVLFEPGRYQKISESDVAPKMVPTEESGYLATPFGLLINELQHSPEGVITPLLQLLTLAIELDSGTVMNETAVDVMLYLVRLLSRAYNYLWFLIAFSARDGSFVSGWDKHELRNLTPLSKDMLAKLRVFQKQFQKVLAMKLCPMLETWTTEAMDRITGTNAEGRIAIKATKEIDRITILVAKIQAHIVILRRTAPMNTNVASSLLSSIIFLTLRHTWNSGLLIVPETEVYEVMQLQRRRLASYLCAGGPNVLTEVLDGVVRVATSTGGRKSRPEDTSHVWAFVGGYASLGRFTYHCPNPRKLVREEGPKAAAIKEAMGEWFKNKKGEDVSYKEAFEGKTYGLYFSAGWCPPCRLFTPILKHFYERYKKHHPDFEILFVSADRSQDDFDKYYAEEHGDWLTIPYEDSDRRKGLDLLFDNKGIPSFIIISATGTMLNRDGTNRVQRGLDRVLEIGWAPPPLPDLANEVRNEADAAGIKALHPVVSFCPEYDKTVEVSIMTFQFTFKSGHLKALPTTIANNSDVRAVFHQGEDKIQTMQCATIELAETRNWFRIVGRDHDVQEWQTPDTRVVLPQCDREYPEELEEHEMWIRTYLDPIRRKNIEWAGFLIYMPEKPLKDDEVAAYLEAVDFFTGEKKFEIYVFKHLKCAQVYAVYSYGRRHYRSLIYATDARYSMRFVQPDYSNRQTAKLPVFKREAGDLTETLEIKRDCVILRQVESVLNRAGCVEQFIPMRLLYGLLPQCILDTHLFWQDAQDCLRGYPIHQEGGSKPRHLLFIQLRDVKYKPLHESFTVARIIRYAEAKSCPKTRERKKLYQGKKNQAEGLPDMEEVEMIRTSTLAADTMAREMSGDFSMSGRQASSFTADAEPKPRKQTAQVEDQDLLLLNLLHAKEGSPLYSLAQLLIRMEDLSHILVWTSDLNLKDGEPIDLTWVHLPRLKLSFKGRATAEGTQLVSLDHGHLFISNFRNQLLVSLIQCAPHSLLLQDVNGAMSVLVPAFSVKRPSLSDNPFTTELVLNKADDIWLGNCDTCYFLYPVHISLSFLLTPTLASSLYLLLLSFLGRLYEDSFRLAGTVGTDANLTAQENQIFDSIGRVEDIHPEAHACRVRISLQTVDSPLELKWYTPKEVYHYLCKRSKIAATCRLNKAEEVLLMWLVDTIQKKMDIIEEHAKREKGTWRLVAERISYDSFQAMLEGSLNERRAVKGFIHGLQKALREELHLRCPANDVVRLCKLYINREAARMYCKRPAVATLLRNHTVYVKAEEEGLEFADVEVPPLGKDHYLNFDTYYEHLADPQSVKITNHTFQKQLRGSSIHDQITHSLEMYLAGSSDPNDVCGSTRPDMTFLFFIELLTGETAIKVKKESIDGRVLFWLLTPFLYYCKDSKNRKWDHQKLLIAILQAIKHNPSLMEKLPEWAPDRRDSHIRNCKNWSDSIVSYATFMRDTQTLLKEMKDELVKPEDPNEQQKLPAAEKNIRVVKQDTVRLDKRKALLDTACLPILKDSACSARRLDAGDLSTLPQGVEISEYLATLCSPEQLAAFASLPLQNVDGIDGALTKLTRSERGIPDISPKLPFDVSHHPTAKNKIAQLMLDRLHDDMAAFSEKSNEALDFCLRDLGLESEFRSFVLQPDNVNKIIERLEKLQAQVSALHERDAAFLESAIPLLLQRVNEVPDDLRDDTGSLSFLLRRFSRLEVEMWLEYVLGSLISSDLTGDLTKLNPFLTQEVVAEVTQIAMIAILVTSRVGHANKVREELSGILELLRAVQEHRSEEHSEEKLLAVLAALQQKSGAVARTLTMSRSYLLKEEGKATYMFDPRFMLFEFTWNIVLRGSQITMVKNFVRSLEEGKSHVKQMIMGAGKTTVVGPLVVLMSADGKRLMMQVVPPSLLDFSRGVLRSTFGGLIPKQIYSFVCDRTAEIDAQVVSKFLRAAEARGVVVTTPSSLKSIYLKFVEGLDRIEDKARPPPPPEHETETRDLKTLLSFWRERSVLVMDEVDLLLHPLKSELNFPIGEKHDLPLAPVRWRLPIHLLDAVFHHKLGRISVQFKDSPKAKEILKRLDAVLKKGFEVRALQDTPHVILLNLTFYAQEIKPVMAQWLHLWLEAHHVTYLSEEDTLVFLTDPERRAKMADMVESTVPKHDIQLLNMGFDWLHAFLPHVLQKIDRVSFGIMTPFDIERALEENPQMPRSRIKLAIPFIGKDLPSQSSEFAHPDVVIGLSVLAYRYEGLREADFTEVLKQVQTSVEKEVGKYSQRKTNKMYEKWIDAANGKLLVNFDYQKGAGQEVEEVDTDAIVRTQTGDGFDDPVRKHTMILAAYAMVILTVTESMFVEVVPLRKLKQSNREEVVKLFKLLRLCPEVVHWFLEELVFPEYLRHQVTKLSASGQEIGSNVIFKSRIGFSGTPSDLLPHELGKCDYERCTDGQLIHTLTSPQTVSYHLVDKGWTVTSILDAIADQQPPFHALIDTGALITGLSNLEVAQFFMSEGRMPQMEGCVFLDELDRKMILVRASGRVIKLEECGIPKLKRFTFYDQVHTTGLDVAHTPNAQAALTLGKDMTFRDFAQGAYRMRGIGTGQTIDLIIIPEVYDLIRRELKLANQSCPADPPPDSAMCMDEDVTREVLVSSVAWLMINSMRTEKLQYNQLCIQKVANVYRKEAFNVLLEQDRQFSLIPGVKPTEYTLQALNIYREPIQFQIPDVVPQDELFGDVLQKMVDHEDPPHKKYITAEGMEVVERVLGEVRAEKQKHQENHDVQMVQEQEEEKEEEVEKEEEKMIEVEKYIDLVYSRDGEEPTPWNVETLASVATAKQFYAMTDFKLYRRRTVAFPDSLMTSKNFFDTRWSGERRIKNVVCVMEWIPTNGEVVVRDKPSRDFGEVDSSKFVETMKLFAQNGPVNIDVARDLFRIALGIDAKMSDVKNECMKGPSLSLDDALAALNGNALRHEESGRHFVCLALVEAETIRRVMHVKARLNQPFLVSQKDAHVSLRCVPSGGVVLDRTPGFPVEKKFTYQADKAQACFKYFDGEVHYSDRELNLLLRCLHVTPPAQRLVFFQQVVGCRRRGTVFRWEATPLSKVCRLIDAYALVHQRALGTCICLGIEKRDLSLGEAFTAFNSSGSGVMLPSEVWGALAWLGIEATSKQVLEFIAAADSIGDGNLSYPDFLAITVGAQDEEDLPDDGEGKNLPTVEPLGEALLRKEAAAQRVQAQQDHKEAMELEEEADRQAEKRVFDEEDEAFKKAGLTPNPHLMEDTTRTIQFNFATDALPRHVLAYGMAVPVKEKFIRDDLKEETVQTGWDLGAESFIKFPLRLISSDAMRIEEEDYGSDSDDGMDDAPDSLLLYCPNSNLFTGVYTMTTETKEDPSLNPVWQKDDKFLYLASGGSWMVGTGADCRQNNTGRVQSCHKAFGLMPHKIKEWKRAEGAGQDSIWNTDSAVFFCTIAPEEADLDKLVEVCVINVPVAVGSDLNGVYHKAPLNIEEQEKKVERKFVLSRGGGCLYFSEGKWRLADTSKAIKGHIFSSPFLSGDWKAPADISEDDVRAKGRLYPTVHISRVEKATEKVAQAKDKMVMEVKNGFRNWSFTCAIRFPTRRAFSEVCLARVSPSLVLLITAEGVVKCMSEEKVKLTQKKLDDDDDRNKVIGFTGFTANAMAGFGGYGKDDYGEEDRDQKMGGYATEWQAFWGDLWGDNAKKEQEQELDPEEVKEMLEILAGMDPDSLCADMLKEANKKQREEREKEKLAKQRRVAGGRNDDDDEDDEAEERDEDDSETESEEDDVEDKEHAMRVAMDDGDWHTVTVCVSEREALGIVGDDDRPFKIRMQEKVLAWREAKRAAKAKGEEAPVMPEVLGHLMDEWTNRLTVSTRHDPIAHGYLTLQNNFCASDMTPTDLHWDRVENDIGLANRGRTAAAKHNNVTYHIALASRGITKGFMQWEITPDRDIDSRFTVGVCTDEVSLYEPAKPCISWNYSGSITNSIDDESFYDSSYSYKTKDKLRLKLNMTKGTLEISCNESRSKKVINIKEKGKKLYPFVQFGRMFQQATIKPIRMDLGDSSTTTAPVLKAYIDGNRVEVERQPRLTSTRLSLEQGFQLFGGEKVSSLHMNGAILRSLDVRGSYHPEDDVLDAQRVFVEKRKEDHDRNEANEEALRKKQAEEKKAATKGGELDPDADDDEDAKKRRNRLIVVGPKDELCRKAKMKALSRWRRQIVGEDKVKGKEKEDKMIMEKLYKVIDMKLNSLDQEHDVKKKPLERQLEVLGLERDHAASQGIAATAIEEKIENYNHRVNTLEKQRQLSKIPQLEKKDMVSIKYIHCSHEHQEDRDYHACRLKQAIVNNKGTKIQTQTDIKVGNIRHQQEILQRQVSELMTGSPDWERVTAQCAALAAREKKAQNQGQKERAAYRKLATFLSKELDKLEMAKEKAERARQRLEDEKQKQEQGFSSARTATTTGRSRSSAAARRRRCARARRRSRIRRTR